MSVEFFGIGKCEGFGDFYNEIFFDEFEVGVCRFSIFEMISFWNVVKNLDLWFCVVFDDE